MICIFFSKTYYDRIAGIEIVSIRFQGPRHSLLNTVTFPGSSTKSNITVTHPCIITAIKK